MAKLLVLYYSTYGHIEQMARAVAEGARSAGATVDLKRAPETVREEIARNVHFKLEQYDAIVIGAPTRYGRMPSQMAAFLDQTGGLRARGALNGKVWARPSPPPPRSTAGRRRRCFPSSPTCCTSAWW